MLVCRCVKLVESYPNRLVAVILVKGGSAKYCLGFGVERLGK